MARFDAFFAATVSAAGNHARTAVNDATDPLSLQSRMSHEAATKFIAMIKPIASTPEFRAYLELVLLRGYQHLFTVIDGIAGISPDEPVALIDSAGNKSKDMLYLEFERYLHEAGYFRRS